MQRRRLLAFLTLAMLLLAVSGVAAAPVSAKNINAQNTYTVTDLVSDTGVGGSTIDPNLVNGWGLTAGPSTPWWVANNGTGTSNLIRGDGTVMPLVVSVPNDPTGAIFNGTSDFVVSSGSASGPARFLFAGEAGSILGWNPNVPAPSSTVTEVGAAASDGAVYKGLAMGTVGNANFLYATDFHNAKVDVYDASFTLQSWAGAFVDPGIPAGYAPFGIQNINGTIFVTFAKQDADAHDEVDGPGLGFVDAFAMDGSFLERVASRGDLDAPWGLAWAPATGFGRFSGDLIVGNFGDGRIHAFAPTSSGWEDRGHLKTANHHQLVIDGLWGIGFGNNGASGPATTLYFAAGPDAEGHGLFGSISVNP